MALFVRFPIISLWILSGCLSITCQLISPCPRLFSYEPKSEETDRWYGVITLLSDADLNGIWLRIFLDKPAIQLGNWFGEVSSDDNKEFIIKNDQFKLIVDVPLKVRFFVKYDPAQSPPKLIEFQVNARSVCSQITTTTENYGTQLFTSNILTTTPKYVLEHISLSHSSSSDLGELDFFPGDMKVTYPVLPSSTVRSNTDENCGILANNNRISAETTKEFPWYSSMYFLRENGVIAHICDGILVSNRHILTAARCVADWDPEDFMVYLGKYYLKRWTSEGIQKKNVDTLKTHPEYNPINHDNDLAIVRLTESVTITDYVRPICLPDRDQTSQNGTVVGWGYNQNGHMSDNLITTSISRDRCLNSSSNRRFCGTFRRGIQQCNDQWGSGLVVLDSRTNLWKLSGIIADNGHVEQLQCNRSKIITFTNVVQYLDWIKVNLL